MSRVLLVAAFLATILMASRAAAQDILIELDRFGVGSAYRPGGWVAARFRLTLRSGDAQTVQLVWETPNGDGDIAENTRSLVLNPGAPTVRWLSAWLPPFIDQNSTFAVRVFADDDGTRGAELASARVSPTSAAAPGVFIDPAQSLLGILGDARMSLDAYSVIFGVQQFPRGMHELTRVIAGLDTRELPDRWEGLGAFEALIWTDATPSSLELEEGDALRQYIERGGQLVIILPQAGNPWGFGSPAGNPLSDLLPSQPPRRIEGVPIGSLTPLLSKVDGVRNEKQTTSIHVWDPATLDRGWTPFLAMPAERDRRTGALIQPQDSLDGLCVGVQRIVQHGRITLVGMDVASISRLGLQAGGLPQADAFWNRVLGRRGDTPSGEELDALDKATPRMLASDSMTPFRMGGGELISSRIGMTGAAVTGTLLALVVFAAYWLIAGPVGFLVLKRTGRARHAWLAFLLTGLVFTVLSWVGGAAIRLGSVRLQHVTVLDHVARVPGAPPSNEPQLQRALSWMSVYLPGYGSTEVGIRSDPGQRDLLAAWLAPGSPPQRFPNVDRYVVPYSSPNAYRLPSRATATLLEARWLGTGDEALGRMPYASDPTAPIREVIVRAATQATQVPAAHLQGRIKHGLRGPLTHVNVVYVSSLRGPPMRMRGASGAAAAMPAVLGELPSLGLHSFRPRWDPGEELDLEDLARESRTQRLIPLSRDDSNSQRSLRKTFEKRHRADIIAEGGLGALGGLGAGTIALTSDNWARMIEMLSFFNMLPSPAWLVEGDAGGQGSPRFLRQLGRELDLSSWFTRPCLIIIGVLEESSPSESTPCPVPIEVSGERPASSGLTVVRWICPLPVEPDMIPAEPRTLREEGAQGDRPAAATDGTGVDPAIVPGQPDS